MSVWVAKAVIQKTISFLPYSNSINYWFQKHITKGVRLTDALMEDKLIHCGKHLEYYTKYGKVQQGFSALEIGTGWYPIVPIGLYLAGAGTVYSIDISSLLKSEAVKETVSMFLQYHQEGKLQTYLKRIDPERLEKLGTVLSMNGSPVALLEPLNIKPIVGDARKIDLPDGSIDLINSNNTFEHIYPGILSDILAEFKRVLRPDGIMSHFIDMSDHFAHLDKSITIYNYLKFSDREWAWIDNSVQPQNRLRLSDYLELFAQAGLKIIDREIRPGSVEELSRIKPDAKYASKTLADLAVSHCLLVAKKA